MRANTVGTQIKGTISFRQYITEKYDGLFPESYPTKEEYRKAVSLRDMKKKAKMDRAIRKFQLEWLRQQ